MKLLTCVKCSDIFSLRLDRERTCICGSSGGRYLADELSVEYYGPCYPIGFSNCEFITALRYQPKDGFGKCFTAFVIPQECPTMRKIDEHYALKKVNV